MAEQLANNAILSHISSMAKNRANYKEKITTSVGITNKKCDGFVVTPGNQGFSCEGKSGVVHFLQLSMSQLPALDEWTTSTDRQRETGMGSSMGEAFYSGQTLATKSGK